MSFKGMFSLLVALCLLLVPTFAQSSTRSGTPSGPVTVPKVTEVKPGETYTTSDGVKVENTATQGTSKFTVREFHPNQGAPWSKVDCGNGAQGKVSGLNAGDELETSNDNVLEVNAEGVTDADQPEGNKMGDGGINITGNGSTITLTGNGNDVDFYKSSNSNTLTVNGNNNNIDLNGSNNNWTSNGSGNNGHN
ncbi:MAG: hypothetical protein AAB407_00135 [Patescibacteria group bacterium]